MGNKFQTNFNLGSGTNPMAGMLYANNQAADILGNMQSRRDNLAVKAEEQKRYDDKLLLAKNLRDEAKAEEVDKQKQIMLGLSEPDILGNKAVGAINDQYTALNSRFTDKQKQDPNSGFNSQLDKLNQLAQSNYQNRVQNPLQTTQQRAGALNAALLKRGVNPTVAGPLAQQQANLTAVPQADNSKQLAYHKALLDANLKNVKSSGSSGNGTKGSSRPGDYKSLYEDVNQKYPKFTWVGPYESGNDLKKIIEGYEKQRVPAPVVQAAIERSASGSDGRFLDTRSVQTSTLDDYINEFKDKKGGGYTNFMKNYNTTNGQQHIADYATNAGQLLTGQADPRAGMTGNQLGFGMKKEDILKRLGVNTPPPVESSTTEPVVDTKAPVVDNKAVIDSLGSQVTDLQSKLAANMAMKPSKEVITERVALSQQLASIDKQRNDINQTIKTEELVQAKANRAAGQELDYSGLNIPAVKSNQLSNFKSSVTPEITKNIQDLFDKADGSTLLSGFNQMFLGDEVPAQLKGGKDALHLTQAFKDIGYAVDKKNGDPRGTTTMDDILAMGYRNAQTDNEKEMYGKLYKLNQYNNNAEYRQNIDLGSAANVAGSTVTGAVSGPALNILGKGASKIVPSLSKYFTFAPGKGTPALSKKAEDMLALLTKGGRSKTRAENKAINAFMKDLRKADKSGKLTDKQLVKQFKQQAKPYLQNSQLQKKLRVDTNKLIYNNSKKTARNNILGNLGVGTGNAMVGNTIEGSPTLKDQILGKVAPPVVDNNTTVPVDNNITFKRPEETFIGNTYPEANTDIVEDGQPIQPREDLFNVESVIDDNRKANTNNEVSDKFANIIQEANKNATVPVEDTIRKLVELESGGDYNATNPRNPDVYGKYQFTKSNAKDLAKRLGIPYSQWKQPENQDKMYKLFAEDQVKDMRKRDIANTPLNKYLAHQQGVAGLAKLLNPDSKLTSKDIRKLRDQLPDKLRYSTPVNKLREVWYSHYKNKFGA